MTELYLSEIDEDNWRAAMLLEPAPEQQAFLPSNLFSLAQAAYEPDFYPLAMYNDDDVMVGFAVLKLDEIGDYSLWSIARFMIDRLHQRKGYGRAGLDAICDMLEDDNADGVWVSYVKDNNAAAKLYASSGFVDEGLTWNDEIVVVLRF